MKYFIAYDLGTGGIKTGIYGEDGISRGFCFKAYDTYFPRPSFREQRPEDWWNALLFTTKKLLCDTKISPNDIVSLAVSGHSLGALPIGKDGSLLCEYVPIWNDSRALTEATTSKMSSRQPLSAESFTVLFQTLPLKLLSVRNLL